MMSHISEIRSKVDALCAAARLDARVQQELEQAPAGLLASRGLDPRVMDAEPHSIHMCPWHTCQATRHHEIPVQ
jgi:hypothetical protein